MDQDNSSQLEVPIFQEQPREVGFAPSIRRNKGLFFVGEKYVFVCTFLAAFYYIAKTYRYSFSISESQGGIWNVIQGILTLLGVITACYNFKKFNSNKFFLFAWLYSGLTFVYATIEFKANLSYVFGWLTTLYPAAVFTIFYSIGLRGNIAKKNLLDVAFYAMIVLFSFSYLDARQFDGSRTYLFLGLLPLVVLKCSPNYQFFPFLVSMFPLLFSGKRAGFLAFVLMMFLFFFNRFRRGKRFVQNVRLILFFIVALCCLVYSFNFVTEKYTSRLSDKLDKMEEGDSANRLERWGVLSDLFVRSSVVKEIFGYGYLAVENGTGYLGLKAHNDYLEILYRFGLLGLGLYLALIVSLLFLLLRALRFCYRYAIFIELTLAYSLFLSMFSFYMTAIESITSGMICFGILLGDFQRFCLSNGKDDLIQ